MMNRLFYVVYPSLLGMLFGLIQTGLFFQLSFTLSSSFRTFLMVTICWLIGSAIGIQIAQSIITKRWQMNILLLAALLAYYGCALFLRSARSIHNSGRCMLC
jgi:ABC-type xylose transport system permease subunit